MCARAGARWGAADARTPEGFLAWLAAKGEEDAVLKFVDLVLEWSHDNLLFAASVKNNLLEGVEGARAKLLKWAFARGKTEYAQIGLHATMDYGPREGPVDDEGNTTVLGRCVAAPCSTVAPSVPGQSCIGAHPPPPAARS